VGFLRDGGDVTSVLKTYAILSVGEGLVAQLPALLISTASGLMVTRAGQERSMGREVAAQLLGQPKALGFSSLALALMAFVPGFPATVFLAGSGLCYALYSFMKTPNAARSIGLSQGKEKVEKPPAPTPTGPEAVLSLLTVDPIEIEIGYGLTKIADPRVGGDLPDRITATRRQIASELGFVMPTVRIRDSVHLRSNEYVIKVRGEEVARGEATPGQLLAVTSGGVTEPIAGHAAKDPVFGLDALWIEPNVRDQAERGGYTVIEPSAVLSTHLSETVRTYSAELLSRQDVQTLLDNAKAINEAAVTELVPNVLQIGDVQKVLQHLLRERVPIRDMVTILETMADFGARVKDPDQLGELVRASISRTITRQFVDFENKLYCITLEPVLEQTLAEAVNVTSFGSVLVLEPEPQRRLLESLQREMDRATAQGFQAVLLCGNALRLPLRRLMERYLPGLNVLAYNEVAPKADVEFVGQVRAA
jgi:flagellar biosynthesis protein FlhA